jgi:hypothetical protein
VQDLHTELREFREEQAAASRDILDRLQRLNIAHPLDASPSLSETVVGGAAEDPQLSARLEFDLDVGRTFAAFGAASSALLAWPQETAGRWLDRPELTELHAALRDPEGRVTVLLGPPGSGKSALLARLGEDFRSSGMALLALKADQIDRGVSTIRQLQERHLSEAPAPMLDCLAAVALAGPAVLLIDQLDALSELMDRQTGRLSALLALVNAARRIENLWIIVSCREFDFRRDARLTALAAAEVKLSLLAWSDVEPLLLARGLQPNAWQEEFREVLRTPQHLNVFLKHLVGREGSLAYARYQDMLEEVFQRRVLDTHGDDAARAAYEVAKQMAEDEDLWVPVARFDAIRPQIKALLAEEILIEEEGGRRLGFRHQTFFDFVRARAFVVGGASIAEHALARQDALFVRPVVYSTLSYLRGADAALYRREFTRLWLAPRLRNHLRFLLLEFLAQQQDPTDQEAGWLLPFLDNEGLRSRILRAMTQSQGWFHRIRPRLGSLMLGDERTAWSTTLILQRALEFAAEDVIDLIEEHWRHPYRPGLIYNVLHECRIWNHRTITLAEGLVRPGDASPWVVRHLLSSMARSDPDVAVSLIAVRLASELERLRPLLAGEPNENGSAPLGEGSARGRFEAALRGLTSEGTGWYGLVDVVRAAPGSFIRQIWPSIQEISEHFGDT